LHIQTPCILIDRDGTIIADAGYLADPSKIQFLPGALEGLAFFARLGIPAAGVTNQSGVGRGMFSLSDAQAVNAAVSAGVAAAGGRILDWFICPHHPDEGCVCRKPKPGLAEQARDLLGFDLAQAIVIGDKASDVDMSTAIGARGILISTDGVAPAGCRPDFVARTLLDAAEWVARKFQPPR
jgi:D-glycero-D-manno-heptose 1,7-bisphosphate phosphatase